MPEYDTTTTTAIKPGLRNANQLLMQRATLRGFIVTDHVGRYAEIIGKLAAALGEGSVNTSATQPSPSAAASLPMISAYRST